MTYPVPVVFSCGGPSMKTQLGQLAEKLRFTQILGRLQQGPLSAKI